VAGTEDPMLPVQRVDMITSDVDVVSAAIGQVFAQHRMRIRRDTRAPMDGCLRSAAAGPLNAGLIRQVGMDYQAQAGPVDGLLAAVVVRGTATVTSAREQVAATGGGTMLLPLNAEFTTDSRDIASLVVKLPWEAAAGLAEEHAGLPAADLRFESIAAVSETAGGLFAQTARFVYAELVSSGIAALSPLVAHEMTRLAASAMLATFPNTTMTVPYLRSPGRVPSAAVRLAADYMHGSPDLPVTLAAIARQAGASPRALQHAFRRYYGTTPMTYLRQIRLERAHQDLQAADPSAGDTVAAIARRWGWAHPGHFAAVYRQRYGIPPGRTLRG
jgi:AraC-like DNA-binding protein